MKEIHLENQGMVLSVELPIKAKKKGFKFMELPIEITYFKQLKGYKSTIKQGMDVFFTILKYGVKK